MKGQDQSQDVWGVVDFVEIDFWAVWSRVSQMFFAKMILSILIAQLKLWRFGFAEFLFFGIESIKRAQDLVEYAETAAKYEYINLSTGELGEGLSAAEIRAICETFNVQQSIF